MINNKEILVSVIKRLKENVELQQLVRSFYVYNRPKQDGILPYISVYIDRSDRYDTKVELGYQVNIMVDIWSEKETDGEVLDIGDIVRKELQYTELDDLSFQNISLEFDFIDVFRETDDNTAHAVLSFIGYFSE